VADHLERISKIIASAEDAADMRRSMGAAALDMDAAHDGSWQTRWRATVASWLPSHRWPERSVLITAVDAHNGAPVVFDRDSGIDLADAIAASCASGLPCRIGATDTSTAVSDPTPRMPIWQPDTHGCWCSHPPVADHCSRWSGGMHLTTQVDELRAGGSRVVTIFPDSSSEHMFGASEMDLSVRPPAPRTGYDQGRALAEQLAEFWR
jgi:NTE family protein